MGSPQGQESIVTDAFGRAIAPIHLRLGEIHLTMPAATLVRIVERIKQASRGQALQTSQQAHALAGMGKFLSGGIGGAIIGSSVRMIVQMIYGMFSRYANDYPAPTFASQADPIEAAMSYLVSFGLALLASREWELIYTVIGDHDGGEIVITDVSSTSTSADTGTQTSVS